MSETSQLSIVAEGVQKRYQYRPVFDPVSFSAEAGEIIAITGSNGAGKSTLLKIISNVLSPTKGKCEWRYAGKRLDNDTIRRQVGFVAPYLELYSELTALEHMELVARMKGHVFEQVPALQLLDRLGLAADVAKGSRTIRAFSSGMKQRVRIAMALELNPQALMLDEPTNNLDEDGVHRTLALTKEAADRGAIVLIATNEPRERAICTRELSVKLSPSPNS